MQFKKGNGWKACYNEETGRYTAEEGGCGSYHLYELTKEQYERLTDETDPYDAVHIITEGRHLYMDIDDRCGPPYTIVFDDEYRELCPWAKIVSSGKVWPKELTDAAVELFESEKPNREYRKKKKLREAGSAKAEADFLMKLEHGSFVKIKDGTKTIEMRLFDEKRSAVSVGDIIEFEDLESGERLDCTVLALYRYASFAELYANHSKLSIGYEEDETADPADMLAYYSEEDIERYGVVGIELKPVKDE